MLLKRCNEIIVFVFVASSFLKISSCYSRLFERHPIGAEGLFERIPRVFGPLLVKYKIVLGLLSAIMLKGNMHMLSS